MTGKAQKTLPPVDYNAQRSQKHDHNGVYF